MVGNLFSPLEHCTFIAFPCFPAKCWGAQGSTSLGFSVGLGDTDEFGEAEKHWN